ncbi:hypothetical protein [Methylobacterium indicum]|uniref:Uncharacterized protein n=1 Tax=Methylobacterium indicum TaxID=1775910 RepID=A0A8H8WQ07_9HYPH|nr:hypothetical protein [Methylobacterium indicum]BCM82244.1 hypothetical protein mvi_07050 [Methylobacterium indicum]
MAAAQRQEAGSAARRVLVSNTAANMVSSLHPFDKSKAEATLAAVRSSFLDAEKAKIEKIAGVDNAFVASVGDLRVMFKTEGDTVIVTSVIAPG